LQLDAEALYGELRQGVRGLLRPDSALVGIWSGGA
jgi:pyrimidine operon attenuation protein/uracil phosphoribosyltransferase